MRRSQGPAWTRAPTRVAAPADVTSTALAPQPLAERLAAVQARIAATCARAHRDPTSVKLLPVSKTVPTTRLRHALALGLRDFGEWRLMIYSLMLIFILFFLPNGIVAPTWNKLRNWRSREPS